MPVPLDVVEAHPGWLLDAIQAQVGCVVTLKFPGPPPKGWSCDVGCNMYVHVGVVCGCCVTLCDALPPPPLTVIVAWRAPPEFGCTV